MMIGPLFPHLTREQAIKLYSTDWKNKTDEINQLYLFLKEADTSYAEDAAYEFLKLLAVYEEKWCNTDYFRAGLKYDPDLVLPECIYEAYRIMFDAYYSAIIRLVSYKYEIETWDGPLGEIDSSVTAYDEETAWDEYNALVTDGYNVRLLKINLLKEDEDWCNACEVIASNF